MQVEEGIIEKIMDRKALVRIQQSSGCTTCESRHSCDVASNKKKIVMEVANNLQAKIGDRVEISIPESSLLKLSLLVYLLPVVALLIGALMGSILAHPFQTDSTLTSIIGGAIAMAVVFCVLKVLDRRTKTAEKYYPRMTRILHSLDDLTHF